ncbi:MAG: sodium/solute symporter [Calditrichaeota bacterium]|nr:sodium/solute symporter [Calditrichota bacterium]
MTEQFSFRAGDIFAIILYFVGIIGVGVWTTKKIKVSEDFFIGGRSMPGWAVGISLLGTAISSVTFLAYPGTAFAGNWSRLLPGLMLPIAAFAGIIFFVVFYRRSGFVSAYEYFEKRFGVWGRSYASFVYVLFAIYRVGTVLFLLALPLRVLTGWNLPSIIVVVGILVTLYTLMGGLEAVIWTDVVQTILLVLGGLFTVAIIFSKVDGGMFGVLKYAADAGKFKVTTSWNFDLTRDTFWMFTITGIIGNIQEFSTDQIKIQRYLAPSTDKEAKRATLVVGLGCIPVWALFMFVGTCIWVFYQHHIGLLPAGLRADEVYPHFILTQLPEGLGGFVIAAVMAAAMSTIDSGMNAGATVVTVDWYKKFFVKDRDDKHYLTMGRVFTLFLGGLGIFAAYELSLMNTKTFLDLAFFFGAVFSAGLGGFFLLGFFFKRANSQGAKIGVAAGVIMILWLTASNLATFNISDQALDKLKSAGLSENIIIKLSSFKDQEIRGKGEFINKLEDTIGKKETDAYKSLIMKESLKASLLPFSLDSSIHPFVINVFGNLTVLLVGLFASLFWPAPSEESLRKATWWTRNDKLHPESAY